MSFSIYLYNKLYFEYVEAEISPTHSWTNNIVSHTSLLISSINIRIKKERKTFIQMY